MTHFLHADGPLTLATANRDFCGFLTEDMVAKVAADNRTRMTNLLVRCGNARFVAAAQYVKGLIDAIEASGQDYVRDVSIPA